MELSVFGWAADQNGCGYYRIGLPIVIGLGQVLNIKTQAATSLPPVVRREAAVIVGQRVCIEGASITWQGMAKEGKPLVMEIDDDLLGVTDRRSAAFEFFGRPDIRRRLVENIEAAGLVTTTNEYLASKLAIYNPNVAVIPNYIDEGMLSMNPHREPGQIVIGWSGSATHYDDFVHVGQALRRYFRYNPESKFHCIGANYTEIVKAPRSEWTGWLEDVPSYYHKINFDIGVIPLAPSEFNRSKSYIKALEYAALGIPVVASDFGPYREFVRHGETGFLVSRYDEWGKYLRMLSEDAGMRNEMGLAGRKLAASHTIQGNAQRWLDPILKLVG